MSGWFDVDRAGLAKLLHNKDRSFILNEVGIQNTADETDVSRVDITLEPVPGKPQARFTVIDDAPEGFNNLRHAWTLYANSYKKDDPTKRGFMNLGEKLALSLAIEAHILTTTGGVRFNRDETRTVVRKKREAGSEVSMLLRITREQCAEIEAGALLVIPPPGILYTFNGKPIETSVPIKTFPASMPTVKADAEGNMARTTRNTTIEVYEPLTDDGGWLYEMGIPVVRIGGKWSVSIQQKVPLNMNRDNVTPSYLKRIRTLMVNHLADLLTEHEASEPWVKEATASKDIDPDAYLAVMDKRFGEKRVMFDPSDPEAGMNAVAQGYTLLRGNQLSGGERDNMRRFRAEGNDPFTPAGRKFPTAKPFSDDPNAEEVQTIPESDWTPTMKQVVGYCSHVFKIVRGDRLTVTVVKKLNDNRAAAYGGYQLYLTRSLLRRWTQDQSASGLVSVNDTLIHEFAHHGGVHHLDHRYYKACTRIGATLTGAALAGELKPRKFGFTTK